MKTNEEHVDEMLVVIKREQKVLNWMKDELRFNNIEYDDCGELNCTKLGEAASEALDISIDEPEHWIFDIAWQAAEWWQDN